MFGVTHHSFKEAGWLQCGGGGGWRGWDQGSQHYYSNCDIVIVSLLFHLFPFTIYHKLIKFNSIHNNNNKIELSRIIIII